MGIVICEVLVKRLLQKFDHLRSLQRSAVHYRQESNEKERNTDKKVINLKECTVFDKKDKGKQEVDLKCDMCEYTCKKINILYPY